MKRGEMERVWDEVLLARPVGLSRKESRCMNRREGIANSLSYSIPI